MNKEIEIQKKAEELLNIGAQAYRESDYDKAEKCYRQSADLGHPQAACNLGYIYAYGRTGNRDPENAFYCFNLASINGNANASYKVGGCLLLGKFCSKAAAAGIPVLPAGGIPASI
ncbi:tetratricopeptide repeat protein [Limosilactobacillus antri]|uniref:tetratricopeptide repeat protein n=1 Tax=Limosilactobacillus antri TaxID=227943 RepID=UPI000ADE762A|nr:hypothetical protein [Limosilactobacillus antri]